MNNAQIHEIYVYFYLRMFFKFVFTFVKNPEEAVERLAYEIPGTEDKLTWIHIEDFEWLYISSSAVEVVIPDKKKQLFRAARDAVKVMKEHFTLSQKAVIAEIEWLLEIKSNAEKQGLEISSPLEYLYMLDIFHKEQAGGYIYLENPLKLFMGQSRNRKLLSCMR